MAPAGQLPGRLLPWSRLAVFPRRARREKPRPYAVDAQFTPRSNVLENEAAELDAQTAQLESDETRMGRSRRGSTDLWNPSVAELINHSSYAEGLGPENRRPERGLQL
jgi:hypothetical protein